MDRADRDPVEVEAEALMEAQVLSVVPDTNGQHHVIDYLPMRDAIATDVRTAEARGAEGMREAIARLAEREWTDEQAAEIRALPLSDAPASR